MKNTNMSPKMYYFLQLQMYYFCQREVYEAAKKQSISKNTIVNLFQLLERTYG